MIIHGEGIIQYRVLPEIHSMIAGRHRYNGKMRLREDTIRSGNYYYDIGCLLDKEKEGIEVVRCEIKECDSPPFVNPDLYDKWQEGTPLPKSIEVFLTEDISFLFTGDSIENFSIAVVDREQSV